MENYNNISFTGIRNASYFAGRTINSAFDRYLSSELTGKDLHKFRKAVKQAAFDKKDYLNPLQDNYINVSIASADGTDVLLINEVPVELVDESLPLFRYAARLTRRIAKKPQKDFIIQRDYIKSNLFQRSTLCGSMLSNPENCHLPENIKRGAKSINDAIQRIMEKYLGI